jgi:hypothetical protein
MGKLFGLWVILSLGAFFWLGVSEHKREQSNGNENNEGLHVFVAMWIGLVALVGLLLIGMFFVTVPALF